MTNKMQALADLLSPVVEAAGVLLYDIELVREDGERILRIFIDRLEQPGIDINDCERVSHAAEAVLDEHDPLPYAYALEVSSPGIERKLTRDAHFTRYIGHDIRLRLFAPIENRKSFRGKLCAYESDTLSLEEAPGDTRQFPRSAIASCRLAVFND